MTCRVCDHPDGRTHPARERMFGLRDEFTYFECGRCGCVQLADPPADLGRYYPPTYYSFFPPTAEDGSDRRASVRRWVMDRRNEAQLFGGGGFWGAMAAVRPRPDVRLPAFLKPVPGLRFSSRVLDVGCGSGSLLRSLAATGFRDLTGADPFIPGDSRPDPAVRLLARPIESVDDGPYQLVMFHHSLEHMPDQLGALRAARRLLGPGGTCVIRVPTASSAVWRTYGTDWVELDPPRHFFVHTHQSLRLAAERAGLAVTRIDCDSDAFGYWASEAYRRGLRLMDPDTGAWIDTAAHFTPAELARFAERAAADNTRTDGGRLVAYLSATDGGAT